jgi:hypothetical protein
MLNKNKIRENNIIWFKGEIEKSLILYKKNQNKKQKLKERWSNMK